MNFRERNSFGFIVGQVAMFQAAFG